MPTEDKTTARGYAGPPLDADERLRRVRHDMRGSLGILQGAVQTALDKDLTLSPEQRLELLSIARQALPELAGALEDYIAILEGPEGDIRLPD